MNIKPIIIILVFLQSAQISIAQTRRADEFTRKLTVQRVNLDEKLNKSLRVVPRALLSAFCKGLLKGYYPNMVDAPLFPESFARAFETPCGKIELEFACCNRQTAGLATTPKLLDPSALKEGRPEFEYVIEVIEEEVFDKTTSLTRRLPRYIRLIWVDVFDVLPTKNAILFKYDDCAELFTQVKITNARNEATETTLKQMFDTHAYTSYDIMVSGRAVESVEESEKTKTQRLENRKNFEDSNR